MSAPTDGPTSAPGEPLLTRRFVILAGAVVGGAFSLGWDVAGADDALFSPNAFLRITEDERVIFISPKVEMGQGTRTSMAMLLAEELEVELATVRIEEAPPNDVLYGNPLLGGAQVTGASSSVRTMFGPLRQAGATARTMLISAAARAWHVEESNCRADSGAVLHLPSGRRLSYGKLARAAARLPIPHKVVLKTPESFELIGKPVRRLDTPAKVNGSAKFSIDVSRDGMLIAAVAAAPVFGGRLKTVDDTAAVAIRGVVRAVILDDAVAVVGRDFWSAKQGLAALRVAWDDGANARLSSEQIESETAAASLKRGAVARNRGDVETAFAEAARQVSASYQVPFLAHATMEPMNCTVHLQKDRCTVWVGTQVPTFAQAAVAQILGLQPSQVNIANQLLGGGFGRRLEVDFIVQAAQIARQFTHPVKVIWTREEDIQHDFYRPCYCDSMDAALDASGSPIGWRHRVAGASILSRVSPQEVSDGVDSDAVEGAATVLYEVENLRVEFVRHEPGIPTGFWRGVGPTHSVFAVESFVDELAAVADMDPLAYRIALLSKAPRARAVLELATAKAGWRKPLPARAGRGVSVQFAFGTYLALVAEVAVACDGALRVTRVVCACDCGLVINPDTVRAQIEGGILFGLSAALWEKITVEKGRVRQRNFSDYRVLRIDETPAVEVYLVSSSAAPGGIGEAGTPGIAPAIGNAIFAATGTRLRALPFNTARLRCA